MISDSQNSPESANELPDDEVCTGIGKDSLCGIGCLTDSKSG